jgi:hypothetical protein
MLAMRRTLRRAYLDEMVEQRLAGIAGMTLGVDAVGIGIRVKDRIERMKLPAGFRDGRSMIA